jgi:cell wall-associated NlpC family hydrolase
MTLRLDTPIGQIAQYVEGLEVEVDQAKVREKALLAQITELKARPEPWEVKAEIVIAIAKAFDALKIPYVFGGESISGMDCSGFVQAIFKQVGYNMPRVSKDQAKIGTQISKSSPALWRKGDLIAFDYSGDGVIDHIGIYMGDGFMIHTNTPSTGINIKAVAPSASIVSVNRVLS